jgi:hypothetical protein
VYATVQGLYGLDKKGLVRITQDGYLRMRDGGRFFPHRKGIFRQGPDGKIEEYSEVEGQWLRHGTPGPMVDMAVDPVTGTFYGLKADGKIPVIVPGESWKDLGSLPEKKDVLNLPKVKKTK